MCLLDLDLCLIRTLTIIFQKNTISQETTSFQKCHTCVVEFQINKLTEVTFDSQRDFGPLLLYAPRIQNSPGLGFPNISGYQIPDQFS